VIKLAESIGFKFEALDQDTTDKNGPRAFDRTEFVAEGLGDKTRTVPSEYTADRRAMMKWVYQAGFWIARRSGVDDDIVIL
jgi:hypothetical protein